jgi:flagellar biosynthesis anti-sigma factor FlgM
MKIDSNLVPNTVQPEKSSSGPRKSTGSLVQAEWGDDEAQVSVRTGLAEALNSAGKSTSTQNSRVEALRQAMNNGTYKLNSAAIAEAMVRELF